MSDLKQELERIEAGIRKLKVQYELYFAGGEKVPPTKMHEEIDKLVKKCANMSLQRSADRFYFNNVQSRYNSYSELWSKQLRNREEGRLPSGRPMRAVPGEKPAGARSAAPRGAAAPDDAVRVSLDSLEDGSLRRLHASFGAARSQSGQGDAPAYERFREQIRSQLEALRQKGVSGQVEFRVSAQDGKVSLKARPVR
jgi:hypothetical protein